ncbi:hypothetical protein [uncultured Sphingomonas sp.]|uniref:hypothetical protein n=1 Tax=uncultured Sphingomonas sp. TaxID=158754 RepID=UPI0030F878BC
MTAGSEAHVTAPAADAWQWWSGANDEWYTNGPFATREEAVAALDGDGGYVIEAKHPDPVSFSASALIEAQYLEDNDYFDFDHSEPDRKGPADKIAAADAELQTMLDDWCSRHADTFVRGNLFGEQRNGDRIEANRAEAL